VKPGENRTPANPNPERVEPGESKSIPVQPLRGCVSRVFIHSAGCTCGYSYSILSGFSPQQKDKIKEYRQALIFEVVTGKIRVH
jgi:hypothetical protein